MEKIKKDSQDKLKRINNAMFNGKKPKDLKWVKTEHKKIAKWIEDTYPNVNTKKSFFNALTVVFRDVHPNDKLRKLYSSIAVAYNDQSIENDENQDLDSREQANWKSYEQLSALRDSFKTKKDWANHRKYILLSLYTLTPPIRSEYRDLPIIKTKDDAEQGKNYWLLNDDESWLIIQKDKVSNKVGPAIIRVEPALHTVMQASLKMYPRDFVLGKKSLSKSAFDQFMARLGVGIDMMRSAYITQFYPGLSISKRKLLATKMRHSVEIAQRSYLKVAKQSAIPLAPVETEPETETLAPQEPPRKRFNRQEYAKQYKERNKEKIKQYNTQYYNENYDKILRNKLLWELKTTNTKKPTPESIKHYKLKYNAQSKLWY